MTPYRSPEDAKSRTTPLKVFYDIYSACLNVRLGRRTQGKKGNGTYQLFMDKSMTELRSVTCHMGSHSVTCHRTQVIAPGLNPSHAGRYSIYLPRRDGRLS